MNNNDLHFMMQNSHLRKMIDPKFRRDEQKKQENVRVSRWFDRYCDQIRHHLREKIETEYVYMKQRTMPLSRENTKFVELQVDFLEKGILVLSEENIPKAKDIQNQTIRTLGIEHQELKRRILKVI